MKQEKDAVRAQDDERALRQIQVSHDPEHERNPYRNDAIECTVQYSIY